MFALITKSFRELNPNHVQILSAALSFFLIFSLAPLITISVSILGLFFSTTAIRNQITQGARELIGPVAAELVEGILESSSSLTAGGILALLSFAVLLYAASRIFWQLRVALNIIWGLMPERADLKARLLAMAIVPIVGLVLAAAMLFNAFAGTLMDGPFKAFFASFGPLARVLSMLIAPAVYFGVFALIFKYMPTVHVAWSLVWRGAAATTGLFWIGNSLIWLYLEQVTVRSIYGAAGSLIIFLLWTYYTSWIVLFGAKYTQVRAEHRGESILGRERPKGTDYFTG